MVGTNCSAGAITLGRLPLLPGYYRPYPTSLDVRKCPDAQSNCSLSITTGGCAHSSSGCRGGAHTHGGSTCAPTLDGPFCLLCANLTDHYYVAADSDAVAHCEPCERVALQWSIALGVLVVVLPLAGLVVHRCLHSPWCRTIRDPLAARVGALAAFAQQHSLAIKLKILIGFFQIATQIEAVYDLQLPPQVVQLLHSIKLGITLALDVVPFVCIGAGGCAPRGASDPRTRMHMHICCSCTSMHLCISTCGLSPPLLLSPTLAIRVALAGRLSQAPLLARPPVWPRRMHHRCKRRRTPAPSPALLAPLGAP